MSEFHKQFLPNAGMPILDDEALTRDVLYKHLVRWLSGTSILIHDLYPMRAMVRELLGQPEERHVPVPDDIDRLSCLRFSSFAPPLRLQVIQRLCVFIGITYSTADFVLGSANWKALQALVESMCAPDTCRGDIDSVPPQDLEWTRTVVASQLHGLLVSSEWFSVYRVRELQQSLDTLRHALSMPPIEPESTMITYAGLQALELVRFDTMNELIRRTLPQAILEVLDLDNESGLQLLGAEHWAATQRIFARFGFAAGDAADESLTVTQRLVAWFREAWAKC